MGNAMTGLEILKRDIVRLREAVRLDWQELDIKLLSPRERRNIKEPILSLIVELKHLVEKL
jgi:hypothetical protein